MNDKMDRIDRMFSLALSQNLASVFEDATLTYNLISFTETFISSDLFPRCFEDETVYSQSKKYIIELFQEEIEAKNISVQLEDARYDKDVAYWLGYLFAEWHQLNEFDVTSISHENIEWLYDGYDTLHTQDVQYVYQLYMDERVNTKDTPCME